MRSAFNTTGKSGKSSGLLLSLLHNNRTIRSNLLVSVSPRAYLRSFRLPSAERWSGLVTFANIVHQTRISAGPPWNYQCALVQKAQQSTKPFIHLQTVMQEVGPRNETATRQRRSQRQLKSGLPPTQQMAAADGRDRGKVRR